MLPRRVVVALVLLALAALTFPNGGSATASTGTPSYTWSATPSPVVLLLPSRMVRLRPTTFCWTAPPESSGEGEIGSALCSDGIEPSRADLPKVARSRPIRFWFGRPGWRWSATLTSFAHPRRDGCRVRRVPTRLTAQRFDLAPPRHRGTYRVRLFGQGPEGDVLVSFSWRYGSRPGRCS
ncbi:hypothetical protein CFH99_13030 [Nocardioides aromaticivorans]|uniref:Secreted protein n=1 Tax=Nocardioides aromaticivorans TaxID=200618 RepID=A0ABX7PL54_9ACTN|nr:hypothetical protein [Nocardioides aromaticivorans]QSR26548.1 hypothetical protein CFH99_13030 [Nocardioides aromaticivorans]